MVEELSNRGKKKRKSLEERILKREIGLEKEKELVETEKLEKEKGG